MKTSYYAAPGMLKADVVELVSQFFKIDVRLLLGKTRKREIVEARYIGMYLMNNEKITLREIGEKFNRDHATAIHGLKTVENLMKYDSKFKAIVEDLKAIYTTQCPTLS